MPADATGDADIGWATHQTTQICVAATGIRRSNAAESGWEGTLAEASRGFSDAYAAR
jgi:hypothetical protein